MQVELPFVKPRYDKERRILFFGGEVVKAFKKPAPNQEPIILAFEEEGWPPKIYSPLRPNPEQDPKVMLNRTVQDLNRSLDRQDLIRFGLDHTGEQRIEWRVQP